MNFSKKTQPFTTSSRKTAPYYRGGLNNYYEAEGLINRLLNVEE